MTKSLINDKSQNNSTLEELLAQQEKIKESIEVIVKGKRQEAIAECIALINAYAIQPHELIRKVKPKVSVEPKYKDPVTGVTWSGRGKLPIWLKGKNISDFLIKK